jgi:HK97 family phage portal protein
MATLYHPLVGVSPISACGLAAIQGIRAQEHSTNFFVNGAMPSGILTAPGIIQDDEAKTMQAQWEQGFSGQNFGRVAVLANGLTYKQLDMVSAVDSQFIEQLKLSAEMVCQAFKVPPYKVNVGPAPSYNNVEALDQQYYGQCLMIHLESIELLLDEGLGLVDADTPNGRPIGTEFDLDDLLRMDTPSLMKAASDGVGSGSVAPNEARKRWLNLGPVTGGEAPYLQQQNFSLEALAKRDALADPFATPSASAPQEIEAPLEDDAAETEKALAAWRLKELELIHA